MSGGRALSVPIAIVAVAGALIAAEAAAGDGGSILPAQAWDPSGITGLPGQPGAKLRYTTVSRGNENTLVVSTETDNGKVRTVRETGGIWGLPAVAQDGQAGGLSADGATLVLIGPGVVGGETSFRVLDTEGLRLREELTLPGYYSFDAISPDGRLLYLVEYARRNDPLDYRVRAYDLAEDEFLPGRVVDPEEPEEQMSGHPITREASPDGRWAYTLYGGGDETFIHALDTQEATAVCVDLEQFRPREAFRMGMKVDPATGAITVLRRGDPAARVDPETFEVTSIPEGPAQESPSAETEENQGGWLGWAVGIAGVLVLGVAAPVAFRRRRRDQGIDEDALERLVHVETEQRDEDRECEPAS